MARNKRKNEVEFHDRLAKEVPSRAIAMQAKVARFFPRESLPPELQKVPIFC